VGIEAIGFAVAEVKNPRRAIPRAIRRVFARIAFFYVLGILLVGTLVPHTQAGLLPHTGTGAQSPWVLALSNAGLKGWPGVANAFFLLYAFSACNTAMYVGSRALHALALRGHAPRLFARTSRSGRPWVASTVLACFLPLAYMALSAGAATVFGWFLNITSLTSFITWLLISVTYLRFHDACIVQAVPDEARPLRHWGQPYLAWWAVFWSTVVILFNGWYVFTKGHWRTADFVVRYINIPVSLVLVVFYLVWRRPGGFVGVGQIDLWSNVPPKEEDEDEDEAKGAWWRRVLRVCFG
jgi:amino acid transporter